MRTTAANTSPQSSKLSRRERDRALTNRYVHSSAKRSRRTDERTLVEIFRSIIHSKGLGKRFCAEALSIALYIRNRVTTRSLPSNTTSFHLWMRKAPDLSHRRSEYRYVVPNRKLKKLDPLSKMVIMVDIRPKTKPTNSGIRSVKHLWLRYMSLSTNPTITMWMK